MSPKRAYTNHKLYGGQPLYRLSLQSSRKLIPAIIHRLSHTLSPTGKLQLNIPFKIHSRFQPAGDQPKAIEALVDGLESGLAAQTLLGVTGSGKTFTIANVIERTQRPALVMAPNKT